MRNMTRRLERLEAASGTTTMESLLAAPKNEYDRILRGLSDAELDRIIGELKADNPQQRTTI